MANPERITTLLTRLPAYQASYLRVAWEDEDIIDVDMLRWAEALLDPSTLSQRVNQVRNQLAGFIVVGQPSVDKRVQQGWKDLTAWSNKIAPIINSENACLVVTGSMVYGDPLKGDFDVFLATKEENDSLSERCFNDGLIKNFAHIWNAERSDSLRYFSTQRMQEVYIELQKRNYQDRSLIANLDLQIMYAASFLSGVALLNPTKVIALKREIEAIMQQEPLISAGIYTFLSSILDARKERRGLI